MRDFARSFDLPILNDSQDELKYSVFSLNIIQCSVFENLLIMQGLPLPFEQSGMLSNGYHLLNTLFTEY